MARTVPALMAWHIPKSSAVTSRRFCMVSSTTGFGRVLLACAMRVALGADDSTRVVDAIASFLTSGGHSVTRYGKAAGTDEAWASTGTRVAEAVAQGEHDLG